MLLSPRVFYAQHAGDRRSRVHAVDDVVENKAFLEVGPHPTTGVHLSVVVAVAVMSLTIDDDVVVAATFGRNENGSICQEVRIVLGEVPDFANRLIRGLGCLLVFEPTGLIPDITAWASSRNGDLGIQGGVKRVVLQASEATRSAMKCSICFFSAGVIPLSGSCSATIRVGSVRLPY